MTFNYLPARSPAVPILISVPHCGTGFPDELIDQFNPVLVRKPDDTDWFVDRLYDFAPAMGMAVISAHYSRWVIDLNRDPENKPLYTDGRIITGLCPSTTFLGEPLYQDGRREVESVEINRRRETYYEPYHTKIREELGALKKKFGKVVLWDCHSIRQTVPTIQADKFPDLILGDADGSSAASHVIDVAFQQLQNSSYQLSHNHPFKGGYITRHFGKPTIGQHALQLEMTKVNYMNDGQTEYDEERAGRMRKVLQTMFEKLIGLLSR